MCAYQFRSYNPVVHLDAYSRHKKFINDYVLHYGKPLEVNEVTRTDFDVLRENYRFIRSEEDNDETNWEKRMSKQYYEKLFKEYCLADMSRYKEGKFGFRWRTQKELFVGKGHFTCGNKKCDSTDQLQSYEVNFAYVEDGEHKNALVKLRVCAECAQLLNYKHQQKLARKEEKKKKKKKHKHERQGDEEEEESTSERRKRPRSSQEEADRQQEAGEGRQLQKQERGEKEEEEEKEEERKKVEKVVESAPWKAAPVLEKTTDEEMDEYFRDLFP